MLHLEGPGLIPRDQTVHVPNTGASVGAELWKLTPDVFPVRAGPIPAPHFWTAVFWTMVASPCCTQPTHRLPRALVRRSSGYSTPPPGRCRASGCRTRRGRSRCWPLPDGRYVAYVVPASAPLTASLWPASPSSPSDAKRAPEPETVWVAPADNSAPPDQVLTLPMPHAPISASPEQVTDLVWTPDGASLVAITRQSGPPARARITLVPIAGAPSADPVDLALLPPMWFRERDGRSIRCTASHLSVMPRKLREGLTCSICACCNCAPMAFYAMWPTLARPLAHPHQAAVAWPVESVSLADAQVASLPLLQHRKPGPAARSNCSISLAHFDQLRNRTASTSPVSSRADLAR